MMSTRFRFMPNYSNPVPVPARILFPVAHLADWLVHLFIHVEDTQQALFVS